EMDKLRDEKGNTKSPYTPQQLSKKLQKEFKRLDGNGYFFKYTPRAKVIQNSWFMSSTRISGIAFLPGGEPNINGMPHSTSFPQVMAHEIAHTKGVMRENEANLVSYYVLLTSLDPYLRYCGYLETITWMRTAAGYGGNLDADGKLLDPSGYFDDTGDLDPGGKNFSRYSQMYPLNATIEGYQMWKFWSEYKSPLQWADDLLEKAGEFFNDLYLKLSGVKEGTDSYRQPDNPPVYIPPPKPTDPPAYSLSYNEIQRIFFMIYEERAGKG
ncbi:MAG: DUF3810 domain-containing protein, partial [Firmicutes bacterium]|nr:DUF3810 domain-containing protein [Bacillota bacterium]